MTRTANATYPQKIACLIAIAHAAGHPFICAICGEPILPGQVIQFDHAQAVGRGGQNRVEDIRPVHSEKLGQPFDCHNRKTFRPRSLATTLGGDNFEAKKTDRMIREQANTEPKRAWPSRKMQSRGFEKRPAGHSYRWQKRSVRR